MNNKSSPFVSIREASKQVGREYQTVKFWVEQGILPSVPTPAGWRLIPKAALERFINGDLD
ncbi:MAG: hypothetical protein SFU83_19810 [Meiothermus sp.]|nr:hypothetical protein [Meiothermus sp.]